MRKFALVAGLLLLSGGPVMADPTVSELQEQIYQQQREMENLRQKQKDQLHDLELKARDEKYYNSLTEDERHRFYIRDWPRFNPTPAPTALDRQKAIEKCHLNDKSGLPMHLRGCGD